MPSDGLSLTYKTAKLAANFHYHFSYHYSVSDSFKLELKFPNKKESRLKTVNAESDSHIDSCIWANRLKPFEFSHIDDSISIITIRNFTGENFKKFIDITFKKLNNQKTKNLIIVLRENRGGRDNYGVYLLSYLTDEPFKYYRSMETQLAPNQTTFNGAEHFKRPDFFKDFVAYIKKSKDSKNVIIEPDESFGFVRPGIFHEPHQINYKGKIYILINEMSFSVTSDFWSIMHDNDRATFIGRETGGAFYGNTCG